MKKLHNTRVTLVAIAITLFFVTAYIVCVYKTVIVASEHEMKKKVYTELQITVGEKEHEYIQANAKFDTDEAIRLGYIKTPESNISFINLTKDTALAIR